LIPKYIKDTTIILGPVLCDRCKIELRNLDIKSAKILYENNIPFALMTDHPVVPVQYLIVCASLLAKAGLPEKGSLMAITINAAKSCKLDNRIGSIEVGKDADLAVFSGNPLDIMQKVELTIIDGEIVYDASKK
jgi:imidazolonepropionase-like amidohydrolase